MKINEIRTILGPNLFHHKPVLIMTLDLENLAEVSSADIPEFTDRLVASIPGLGSHRCSKGYEGGFIERLRTGTYFAHITEHIALELSELAGIPVYYGKSVYGGKDGLYKVVVRFTAEEGMKHLLRTAVELAEAVANGQPFDLAARIKDARRIIGRTDLGPSTKSIVRAAEKRKIPWMRLGDQNLIQFGYGKHRRFIQATVTDRTSLISGDIAGDKQLTKTLLRQASIPVPGGQVVSTREEAIDAFRYLRVPVVVKPLDGHQGKGVSIGLLSEDAVAEAFDIAYEYSDDVLVEETFQGKDFRVIVVGNKMVAASERVPAHVIGDGVSTIAELVEIENRNPLRGEGHGYPLTQIETDDPVVTAFLKKHGLSLDQVPDKGVTVFLRETANLSTGGTANDVTDLVHPDTKLICERAARVIGLDICGIDLVHHDISLPILPNDRSGIIEVNAGPGIRMHHHPASGQPRDVGGAIIDMMYPEGTPHRVPIISITGTNGKTTTTRLVGHMLSHNGETVGMTSTDGISIGGEIIARGDTTGPRSAHTVLSDPTVDVAVLETARGGMVRAGLAYDWSDISILTNIQLDHVGQDGIEDLEDILHIKGLVAERVREGGTLILNADDPMLVRLAESDRITKIKRNITYFSLQSDSLVVRKHLASGGTAYFVRSGKLIEARGTTETSIGRADSIPITFGGTADFQIANALAAIAAARTHGVSIEKCMAALQVFRNSVHNEGRANFFKLGQGYLFMDYGHNPEAFRAVSRMASRWTDRRVTSIIGVPGDRADRVMEQSAKNLAEGFARIIIREDYHLRGRKPGEVASILEKTIRATRPDADLRVILDEEQALKTAVSEMLHGEVIIMFFDEREHALKLLRELGAEPIEGLPQPGAGSAVAA